MVFVPLRNAILVSALLFGACRSSAPAPAFDPDLRPASEGTELPAAELAVDLFREDGAQGGSIVCRIEGTPEEVLEMLLDQGGAAGNRAWAEGYAVVSREEGRSVARWTFAGRMGINPEVEIELSIEDRGDGYLVTYRNLEPAFGLARFFGNYRIWAEGAGSLLQERTFIDSGLPFINADEDDLDAGLREDVRRMRRWMGERLNR